MKTISLTRGRVALVDDEDYPLLSRHSWCYSGETGYATTRIGGKMVFIHKLIMGTRGNCQIDHKSGDGLDNRKENLRWAYKRVQNDYNRAKIRGPVTSQYKGVCTVSSDRSKWRATICKDGKRYHIGTFKVEEDAARAYDAAAKEHFGEYARLNFPV